MRVRSEYVELMERQRFQRIGRYLVLDKIGGGGMATVHLGRLLGPAGFARTVAIKQLHPHLASDPDLVAMLLDEARIAACIHHPNVVQTLDVVAADQHLLLVLEYIHGESLAYLLRAMRRRHARVDPSIATAVIASVLHGLHAAHEARGASGIPLNVVHRDVSPQNILVGLEGGARVLDFGIAKAFGRIQTTRDGQIKGKVAYMAPEQIRARDVDRRTDVYAASVVLWEALTGQRLFAADDEAGVYHKVMVGSIVPPSRHLPSIDPGLEEIVMRGLQHAPDDRFATAREMAAALESVMPSAPMSAIAAWVEQEWTGAGERRRRITEIESTRVSVPVAVEEGSTGDPEDTGAPELSAFAPLSSPTPREVPELATVGSTSVPRTGNGEQEDAMGNSRAEVSASALAGGGKRRSLSRRYVALSATVTLAVGALFVARLVRVPPEAPSVAPPVASIAPMPAQLDTPPATPPSAEPLPSTALPDPPRAKPPAPAPVLPRPSASARARPTPSCDPPFTRDADGNRRWKKECLQ